MGILLVFIIVAVIIYAVLSNLSKLEFPTVEDIVKQKGKDGEHIVNYYLQDVEIKGKILNNLYIPTVYGNTTEIDTIFLTTDAIFVIESKNINGDIRGVDDDDEWRSIRDDRTIRFRNPVKQNATHVKYLNRQLRHLIPIYSIIAFNDEANLYNIRIDNSHIDVIHYSELADTINDKLKDDCHFFNAGELSVTYQELLKFTNVSNEVKEKHDNYIRENYGN